MFSILTLANLAILLANMAHLAIYFKVRTEQKGRLFLGCLLSSLPALTLLSDLGYTLTYRWGIMIAAHVMLFTLIFHHLVYHGNFSRVLFGNLVIGTFMQLNFALITAALMLGAGFPNNRETGIVVRFVYAGLAVLALPLFRRYARKPFTRILDDVETASWYFIAIAPFGFYMLNSCLLLTAGVHPSGNTVFTIVLAMATTIAFYCHLYLSIVEKNKNRSLREQIAASGQLLDVYDHYNRELDRKEEAIRMQRHDFRHVLIHLAAMLDDGDDDGMRKYMHETLKVDDKVRMRALSGNKTVNAIVAYYFSLAMEKGVECTASLDVPAHLSIPEAELAVVLGNALDNCVKAASPLGGKGRIRVDAKAVKDRVVFKFANNFLPGGRNDGSGLGLASIRMICDSRDGRAEIDERDGEFRLAVNLPQ